MRELLTLGAVEGGDVVFIQAHAGGFRWKDRKLENLDADDGYLQHVWMGGVPCGRYPGGGPPMGGPAAGGGLIMGAALICGRGAIMPGVGPPTPRAGPDRP